MVKANEMIGYLSNPEKVQKLACVEATGATRSVPKAALETFLNVRPLKLEATDGKSYRNL